MASVAPKPFKDNATVHFLDNMKDFAIKHSAIGVGMVLFGYIATAAFNYSAMRQVSVNREIKTCSGQKPVYRGHASQIYDLLHATNEIFLHRIKWFFFYKNMNSPFLLIISCAEEGGCIPNEL